MRSVRQSGEGWEVHSVLKPKEVDWNVMTLQQQYFVPLEGATAQYRGTTKIEHADSWALSRFVFVARQDCSVELKIADGEWKVFPVAGSHEIQSLVEKMNDHRISSRELLWLGSFLMKWH